MIFKTYRSTIKSLVRSPLFWATIILVVVNVIVRECRPLYGGGGASELIWDTDPRFVLSFDKFLQMIPNHISHSVMFYAVPAFSVVTAMIVMTNDYGKGFFEVEKAGGVRPAAHLFGRLAALVEVNSIVALAASFLAVVYYYVTRGGVRGHGFAECLGVMTVRVLRTFLFCELPPILVFLGLSLFVGAILKNGFASSVVGMAFVIFNFIVSAYFGFRMTTFFNKYLTTNKFSAYLYFTYYDTDAAKTERIGMGIGHIPSPPSEVFTWIAVMLGASLVLFASTAYLTKRRKI